jgi:hypothetical protein
LEVVQCLQALFEDRDKVGRLGDADHRFGGGPQQVFVDHDPRGAGDHRTTAAADRQTRLHYGMFDD